MGNIFAKKEVHKSETPVKQLERSIKHPEWLAVRQSDGSISQGPEQDWFPTKFQRIHGCGPTTAALITAYIARKPDMVSLFKPYKGKTRNKGYIDADYVLNRDEMLMHMEELWRYVKPGIFGLWRASQMSRGLIDYTASKGILLETRLFPVSIMQRRNTKLWPEVFQFIRHNLAYDIPIAWLIYDKGRLSNLASRHWVSIIGIKYPSDFSECTVTVVDHRHIFEVNLTDWLKHSILGGAFVALRPQLPSELA